MALAFGLHSHGQVPLIAHAAPGAMPQIAPAAPSISLAAVRPANLADLAGPVGTVPTGENSVDLRPSRIHEHGHEDPYRLTSLLSGLCSYSGRLSEQLSALLLEGWRWMGRSSGLQMRKHGASHHGSRAYRSRIDAVRSRTEQDLGGIPDYVLEYAPYCHLFSQEEYWPGQLTEHIEYTTPQSGYNPVKEEYQHPELGNLDSLNALHRIYLTSKDDPETYPHWLSGEDNIPSNAAASNHNSTHLASSPHSSSAPATLIVVDKGEYVDAFWFFFYSFNLGNQVLGVRFGNHVGDWEHTAIRFHRGIPIEVFFSEHEWGAAYRWEDVEKSTHDPKRVPLPCVSLSSL